MPAIGPLPNPAPGSTPASPAPLTEEQRTKYDELLADVRAWNSFPISSVKNAESTPLSDTERIWLTRECLLRYLRATKWNPAQAKQRLRNTLLWRREYGTDGLTAEHISEENATGKQVTLGFDKEGRPCLYLRPQHQNTKPTPRQVQHLVYMLERTLDLHPPGQESLALLIDFRNTTTGSQPSMATSKQVLDILQNHYPERLGRALITHLPWYITAFLRLITPFIDPVTKTKLRYNEPLTDHIPASQLMASSGGDIDFVYDHAIYWPALATLAAERRKERNDRWVKAGKLIGESEVYIWGGEEGSVGGAVGGIKGVAEMPAQVPTFAELGAEEREVAELGAGEAKPVELAAGEPRAGELSAGEKETVKEKESRLEGDIAKLSVQDGAETKKAAVA